MNKLVVILATIAIILFLPSILKNGYASIIQAVFIGIDGFLIGNNIRKKE